MNVFDQFDDAPGAKRGVGFWEGFRRRAVDAFYAALPEFARGARAMAPTATIEGRDKYDQLRAQGVGEVDAALSAMNTSANALVGGALPLATPGGVLKRAAVGGAAGVTQAAEERAVDNLILPQQVQGGMSFEDASMSALPAAVMAAILGPRARPGAWDQLNANRAQERAAVDASNELMARQTYVPPEGQTLADVIAKVTGAQNRPESTAAWQEQQQATSQERRQRGMELRQAFRGVELPNDAPVPSSAEQAVRQGYQDAGLDPDSVASAFQRGRAAQDMELPPAQRDITANENNRVVARQAFDIAAARQARADADLAQRGELAPDYQAGNAAATGGRMDSGTRRITLLDGAEPVEIIGVADDGGIRVQMQDAEQTVLTVPAADVVRRMRTVDLPVNQRLAQDFVARSDEPPRGVGVETMAGESMPRRSTDRIAGDQVGGRASMVDPVTRDGGTPPAGEVLPAQRADSSQAAPRDGQTYDGQVRPPAPALAAPTRQLEAPTQPASRMREVDPDTEDGAPLWPSTADRVMLDPDSEALAGYREIGKNPEGNTLLEREDGARAVREGDYTVIERDGVAAGARIAEFKTSRQIASERLAGRSTPPEVAPAPQPKPAPAAARTTRPRASKVVDADMPEALRDPAGPTRPTRPSKRDLRRELRNAGGINVSEAADMGFKNAAEANRAFPGLFRKGGMRMDGVVEWATSSGWAQQHDVDAADRDGVGGSHEMMRTAIRDWLDSRGDGTPHLDDLDAVMAYEREAAEYDRQRRVAAGLEEDIPDADADTLAVIERARAAASARGEDLADEIPSGLWEDGNEEALLRALEDYANDKRKTSAGQRQEDSGRAAQGEGSGAGDSGRGEGEGAADAGRRTESGGEGGAERGGEESAGRGSGVDGEQGFSLEGQTGQEVRAQEAQRRADECRSAEEKRVAQDKARADSEAPGFDLTGEGLGSGRNGDMFGNTPLSEDVALSVWQRRQALIQACEVAQLHQMRATFAAATYRRSGSAGSFVGGDRAGMNPRIIELQSRATTSGPNNSACSC